VVGPRVRTAPRGGPIAHRSSCLPGLSKAHPGVVDRVGPSYGEAEGEVQHGRAGNTRQDQGAIARFVASHSRGLHHVAVKSPDIDRLLGSMATAGQPMIDTQGRPGSRRPLIGFPHPKALGGVLMQVVQRPD
jgi:hypothetical protein